ncbi:glycerophosphodiester phosphodiesterase family protein [Enterococcus sp. UD-01]|jgi:glycerophosphoryl diester phosphodiesterase|uniref:glycerophosphodiester phosphodiesterase family protein n=1 Tax=Enterococcus sp. UD-01 TaxID=3373911 RepID=UPI003839063F
MAVEKILETDTLNQGRVKINAIMDQSNSSVETVNGYKSELTEGIKQAKEIARTAGDEAKEIAEEAGELANQKADQAIADSKTAVDTANRAVSTANQNKQEFDALRNEFGDLVAESGDSNPEIVQARTDTEGIKQSTLQARLTSDFNSRLTTTDAMKMFSGSVNTPKMMDFKGKTAGNKNGNPHQAFSDYTATTLKKPSANWNEFTQDNYNKVVSRDDTGVSTGSSQSGVIPQQFFLFDVKAAIESIAEDIFEGMTMVQVVKYIKDNFVSIKIPIRGKASSPGNKNLKVATFLESADSYSVQMQNSAPDYTDFATEINDSNFIDSEGKINVLVFSDSSNGVTPASIDVDYIGVQITISLSALDVLNKSGFLKDEQLKAHVDDTNNPHQVTKAQVGLGSVPNYSIASKAEAENATSDSKFMSPLQTKNFHQKATETVRQKWREGLNWIAHRGNNTEYPENSIPAYKNANRHWGIETDIQVTSDGHWVVMHDDTVDRTTNGTGSIKSMTLAQFRALRIDTGANIDSLSDVEKTPPILEEYLAICREKCRVPVIEIKTGDYTISNYEQLKTILTNYGYNETNCVIISFDYTVLTNIRQMYPNMELHVVSSTVTQSVIDQAVALGYPATLGVNYSNAGVTADLVNQLHALGLKINVWTVPDTKFEDMKALNVDYITTNSLSGNLRYAALTLLNGFTNNVDAGRIKESYVEEIEQGVIHLSFNVSGGVTTQNSPIAKLPDWAIPMYRQYPQCAVRISTGVAFGTFDVNGRLVPGSATVGTIAVGLNWANKTSWASGSTTYKI